MTRTFEPHDAGLSPGVALIEDGRTVESVCFCLNHHWAPIIARALNLREGDRQAIAVELAEAMNAAATAAPHPEVLAERASKGEGSSERGCDASISPPVGGAKHGRDPRLAPEGGSPEGGAKAAILSCVGAEAPPSALPGIPPTRGEMGSGEAVPSDRSWSPISTAPKDGTEIDIWIVGPGARRIADCRWGTPSRANWGDRFGRDKNLEPQWITRDGCALDRRNGVAGYWRRVPVGPDANTSASASPNGGAA